MNNVQEEAFYSVDLITLAKVLWKNILVIALVAVLAGSAAFGYTAFLVDPQYQATASLYVNSSTFSLGNTNFSISTAELNTSRSLVSIYLYILESRTTMEEVIKEAELNYTPERLRSMISSKSVSNTSAFEVTVTSSDPAEVELIANTIAKILPDRIAEIVDGTSVRIVDYAIIPARRSGPNLAKNTATGILAGAGISVAVIVLFSLLTDRSREMISSADDLRALFPDTMVLAMIPDMRVRGNEKYYSSYYGYGYGPTETRKKGGKANGKRS